MTQKRFEVKTGNNRSLGNRNNRTYKSSTNLNEKLRRNKKSFKENLMSNKTSNNVSKLRYGSYKVRNRFNNITMEKAHEYLLSTLSDDEEKSNSTKSYSLRKLKKIPDKSSTVKKKVPKGKESPKKEVVEMNKKKIPNLTPAQEDIIKQLYKDRKKMMSNRPFLYLKDAGNEASLSVAEADRYPIFFPDVQEVLSLSQNKVKTTRMLYVKRLPKLENTIILVVSGVGYDEYESEKESCPTLNSCEAALEFVSPLGYGDSIEHGFASQLNKKLNELNPNLKKFKPVKRGFRNNKCEPDMDGFITGVDTLFNITSKSRIDNDEPKAKKAKWDTSSTKEKNNNKKLDSKLTPCVSLYEKDQFSRLSIVMSPREMANNKYPLPFLKHQHFVKTKDEYTEVTEKSPMFGLDCEMCLTRDGNELTRVSVVNENHEVVYERLVLPYNRIINYLTKYSGITREMMYDVTTRLPDVHRELREILPSDAILVGQSLNCDLIALKMLHPYVIDTSIIFNTSGKAMIKTKLSKLCAEFLSEKIQDPDKIGHDSIEDSLAALKLVQAKLKHSLEWGNATLGYKRTQSETEDAQRLLLENCKNAPEVVRYRLAVNAIVDDPSAFDPPLIEPLPLNKSRLNSLSKNKENIFDSKLKVIGQQNRCRTKRGKVTVKDDKNTSQSSSDASINSEVVVIGMEKEVKTYKHFLNKHAASTTTYIHITKNDDVLERILKVDSQGDKRLIIAHVQNLGIDKVEKYSKKLLKRCKQHDLFCVSLVGVANDEIKRGALFATIPAAKQVDSVKNSINEHLLSWGHQTV